MANANKNKGKGYERIIAKHLSTVTGFNFERVPNSGAFVGAKNFYRTEKLSKEQVDMFEGDLITPTEWNHIRIECKHYKDISWGSMFSIKGESKLNSWIDQAAFGTRPYWFLLFRINHAGDFVVFNDYIKQKLQLKVVNNCMTYFHPGRPNETCFIVSMDGFFELNKELLNGNNIRNEPNQ